MCIVPFQHPLLLACPHVLPPLLQPTTPSCWACCATRSSSRTCCGSAWWMPRCGQSHCCRCGHLCIARELVEFSSPAEAPGGRAGAGCCGLFNYMHRAHLPARQTPLSHSLPNLSSQSVLRLRLLLPVPHYSCPCRALQANIVLKQQVGLPVEEEQAALAAWTGTPGGTAGGGGNQPEAADSAAPEGTQGAENESVAQAEDEGHAADAGSVGEDCTVDQGQGAAAAARSPVGALSEQGAAPGSRVTRRKRGGS